MNSPYPDLAQLRLDAKKLLRAARDGVPEAQGRLTRTDRAPILADAQFAVARSVGFTSWPALVAAITAWQRGKDQVSLSTHLLLVRRGDRNRPGWITGHDDGGLSARGVSQADALGAALACDPRRNVSAVLSSRRRGSVEMAGIIAGALGLEPSQPTCDLCEMHPGEAEGLTESERIARFGPNSSFVPGAEAWSGFVPRAVESLRRLGSAHRGQAIGCVTEGAMIKASFVAFGDMPVRVAEATTVESGSITEWSCLVAGDVRRVGTWHLRRHNDHSWMVRP